MRPIDICPVFWLESHSIAYLALLFMWIPALKFFTVPLNTSNPPANPMYFVCRNPDLVIVLTGYRGIWANAGTEGRGKCVLYVTRALRVVEAIGLSDGGISDDDRESLRATMVKFGWDSNLVKSGNHRGHTPSGTSIGDNNNDSRQLIWKCRGNNSETSNGLYEHI
jgi:hypothetical protein